MYDDTRVKSANEIQNDKYNCTNQRLEQIILCFPNKMQFNSLFVLANTEKMKTKNINMYFYFF